jgi:hypothetical protein
MSSVQSARVRRLAEELVESGFPPSLHRAIFDVVVEEVDQALRPTVHERRVQSSGSIIDPSSDYATWPELTGLAIVRSPVLRQSLADSRRFADGLSSWLLRRAGGDDEWLMFDRPAGSERDLVILANALSATVVQRHPGGTVRIVGAFGVLRTEGFDWHLEPPVGAWLDAVADPDWGDGHVLRALLEFAVHDLGAQGIGALLIHRPNEIDGPAVEERLTPPPPLHIDTPFHLAALRHALGQIDGAAVFDAAGTLRQLGVRLVPSGEAEDRVDALGGTRHTAGRRYSYDDPSATVVAVSEDGPVTVFRDGKIVGPSPESD